MIAPDQPITPGRAGIPGVLAERRVLCAIIEMAQKDVVKAAGHIKRGQLRGRALAKFAEKLHLETIQVFFYGGIEKTFSLDQCCEYLRATGGLELSARQIRARLAVELAVVCAALEEIGQWRIEAERADEQEQAEREGQRELRRLARLERRRRNHRARIQSPAANPEGTTL